MMQRTFFSALAAILLSAVLVQTAGAVPSTARKAVAPASGIYNPLDLNLDTLVDGTDALNYIGGSLTFQVDLTGTFEGVGYTANGNAGTWRLFLSDTFDVSVTSSNTATNITMASTGSGLQVGTLRYLGGLSVDTGALPVDGSDTPQIGDLFELLTTAAGSVLEVVCQDGTATCNDFDLTLIQNLALVGPYVDICNDACYELDDGTIDGRSVNRVNPDGGEMTALTASSVPEPATLALLGLGLAGLGLSRRART